ncbi:ComF family protein [Vibrio sp. JC009]|uniref:ComF family protein n=1 Tax=Vibrio sp. JC009 TaxID=2912314 RepID=UPI0031836709
MGDYQTPLSGYVSQLKYHHKYRFAYDLSYLLSLNIDHPAPVVIPVPLHWKRYIRRGYNQSWILAHYLCEHLGQQSQLNRKVFRRIKSTPPQQSLSLQARQSNLSGAFQLLNHPGVEHVAIVDDVVTTGSTARHLCQLLLDIGVKKIDIYCICRTPEPS